MYIHVHTPVILLGSTGALFQVTTYPLIIHVHVFTEVTINMHSQRDIVIMFIRTFIIYSIDLQAHSRSINPNPCPAETRNVIDQFHFTRGQQTSCHAEVCNPTFTLH